MKIARSFAFGVLFLTGTMALVARPQSPSNNAQPSNSRKNTAANKAKTANGREGERRFQENCGRCHTEPQAISPREAKAVIQHMRVRASLSAEDAELIRRFLAP